jgi:hypothetical protein
MACRSGARALPFASPGFRRDMRAGDGQRVRFDKRCRVFLGIAAEYRSAITQAEKLWRQAHRASVRRDPAKADAVRRAIAAVEERLDAARAALFAHTREVANDPMRTKVKGIGLTKPRTAG